MNAGVVITLILGLIFQLGWMAPSERLVSACEMELGACECCANGSHCACVSSNETEHQQPLPAPLDKQGELKAPVMSRVETLLKLIEVRHFASLSEPQLEFLDNSLAGFRGMRLSVAFCSYVI